MATVHVNGDMALVRSATGLQKDDRVIVSPMAAAVKGMLLSEQGSPSATDTDTDRNATAEPATVDSADSQNRPDTADTGEESDSRQSTPESAS